MKEIKYRIWNGKSWDYYIAVSSFGGEIYLHSGLEDKNGKGIYEGDIILRHGKYCEGERGVVEYDGCCFRLNRQKYSEQHNGAQWLEYPEQAFENSDFQWCEVIGNIYKNPDLLK